MRRNAMLSVFSLTLLAMHNGLNAQDAKTKTATQPPAKPTSGASTKADAPPAKTQPAKDSIPGQSATASQPSADEAAIRQSGATYVTAFNQADSKEVADHYTNDAEYIDEAGRLIQGRKAIEESMKSFFAANPDSKIELNIGSIRMIGPGVAIEDGTTTVTRAKNAEPATSRYTAVHLKNAGKWLVASVRDTAIRPLRQHRTQLKQLDWMLGDWVHEGGDAVVFFSCELADKGNFLIRHFTIQIAGNEVMSGSQRIGWDAQTGKLKAWIFDSDGGHSEGDWHRDRDTWVLKIKGVTADGQTASSTSIYSFVNEHTMMFQSVDHEVAGVEIPDGAKLKIVRHAPQPE